MSTQTHSTALLLRVDKRKTDKKVQTRSASFVQVKPGKFKLILTICTWIVAVLLFVLFYVAVRTDLAGTDWLAGLLLGMVILGWIMTAYYFREMMKPVHPPVHMDQHDKQN